MAGRFKATKMWPKAPQLAKPEPTKKDDKPEFTEGQLAQAEELAKALEHLGIIALAADDEKKTAEEWAQEEAQSQLLSREEYLALKNQGITPGAQTPKAGGSEDATAVESPVLAEVQALREAQEGQTKVISGLMALLVNSGVSVKDDGAKGEGDQLEARKAPTDHPEAPKDYVPLAEMDFTIDGK